jgi:hypothetical protein
VLGADRAQLGDRDLEVGQHLEQERLELLVGAVDLVDQEDRRLLPGADGAEQRPLEEERIAEDEALLLVRVAAGALLHLDAQHLLRIVPLVEGRIHIQALVALEPN